MSLLQRGCIKSIQRILKEVDTNKNNSIDVDINYVDIDKTVIITDVCDTSDHGFSGYVTFNSNTSIKISAVRASYSTPVMSFCIQVIEFY